VLIKATWRKVEKASWPLLVLILSHLAGRLYKSVGIEEKDVITHHLKHHLRLTSIGSMDVVGLNYSSNTYKPTSRDLGEFGDQKEQIMDVLPKKIGRGRPPKA
jgi:hypothetical protein